MSQPADDRANYCYRHPNRQSFVLCQRCGRTICPECQTPGAVGVICPECMREQRTTTPRTRSPLVRQLTRSGAPVVTYVLIGLSALSYLIGLISAIPLVVTFLFAPVYTAGNGYPFEPWRMITMIFVYPASAIFSMLINMFTLWLFGRMLEEQLGRLRFLALYLLSGVGGAVAVVLLASPTTPVVGATSSIFGLFGAVMVVQRKLGANITGMLILVALNIGIAFIPGVNFVWQAPLGGVLIGALIGFIYMETRGRARRPLQIGLMVGLTVVLILLGCWRIFV